MNEKYYFHEFKLNLQYDYQQYSKIIHFHQFIQYGIILYMILYNINND